MKYFLWKFMPDIDKHKILLNDVCRHCILIPCLDKDISWVKHDSELCGIYRCIYSDCNELTNIKVHVVPRTIGINGKC